MKEKNVPVELRGTIGFGSIWTWTATDADSKLIISGLASDRGEYAAYALVRDLASRTKGRLQLSSDAFPLYHIAIEHYFRDRGVDYGTVVTVYGTSQPQPGMNPKSAASTYSPGRLKSVEKHVRIGGPRKRTSRPRTWSSET